MAEMIDCLRFYSDLGVTHLRIPIGYEAEPPSAAPQPPPRPVSKTKPPQTSPPELSDRGRAASPPPSQGPVQAPGQGPGGSPYASSEADPPSPRKAADEAGPAQAEPPAASGLFTDSQEPAAPSSEQELGQARLDLETIREILGDCQRCPLCRTRTQIVFGVGNTNADLMFVGEAPGGEEDALGLPFVGPAGQLLSRIIRAIGLYRDQVYVANILKCRPPGNRDPEPAEVSSCAPFLYKQIEAVDPLVIVALGRFGAQSLLQTSTPISRLRGSFAQYRGRLLMPTFHPSYLLRNPQGKRDVWQDMQAVRDKLKEAGSRYYKT